MGRGLWFLCLHKVTKAIFETLPCSLALHYRLEMQTILFIKYSGLSRGLEKSFTIAIEIHRNQFWRLSMIQGLLPRALSALPSAPSLLLRKAANGHVHHRAVAYFSMHALYSRYYDGCNHHESFDIRPLLYSKTESKYWYLDYWTV
jgi:hypothetical protein